MDGLDLHSDGTAAWEQVAREPIILGYPNPWFRFAVVFVIWLIAAAAVAFFGSDRAQIILAPIGALAIIAAVSSAYFLIGEKRVGALLAEISKEHFAVGCLADRIVIPWAAVDLQVQQVPLNNQFMAIPIDENALEALKFETRSLTASWDRKPYKRFIVTVQYNAEAGRVEIRAKPNEFLVHLLAFVYPMIAVLLERRARTDSAMQTFSISGGSNEQ